MAKEPDRRVTVHQVRAIQRLLPELKAALKAWEQRRAKKRLRSRALRLGRQARLESIRRSERPDSKEGWLDWLKELYDLGHFPNYQTPEQDIAEGLIIVGPAAWRPWIMSDEPEDIEVVRCLVEYHLRYSGPDTPTSPLLYDWMARMMAEAPPGTSGRPPMVVDRNFLVVHTIFGLQKLGVGVMEACRLVGKTIYISDVYRDIWRKRDQADDVFHEVGKSQVT